MLLNDFYRIENLQGSCATLVLNPAHPIFSGHFPGQPVVPGACQLQMIQEMLSHLAGKEYRLLKALQIKYLTPIDPRRHPRLELTLRYQQPDDNNPAAGETLQLTATLTAEAATFLKFTGTFRSA